VERAAIIRAKHVLDTGRALIEAKSLLKHGRWLPWLKENCDIPDRSVRLCMQLTAIELPTEIMVQIIAAVGMQKATRSGPLGVWPDLFADYAESVQREWLLFMWLTGDTDPEQVESALRRLLRRPQPRLWRIMRVPGAGQIGN